MAHIIQVSIYNIEGTCIACQREGGHLQSIVFALQPPNSLQFLLQHCLENRKDHLALYHRQASACTVNHKQTEGRGDMCHGEGSGKGVEKG